MTRHPHGTHLRMMWSLTLSALCMAGAIMLAILPLGCPPADGGNNPPPPPPTWPPPLGLTTLPRPSPPDPLPAPPDLPQNVRLTPSLLMEQGDGGSQSFLGAIKAVVSPDGTFVYVLVDKANPNVTVEVYSRNKKSFNVSLVQSFEVMVPFESSLRPLNQPRAIERTPDGKYLLVAGTSEVEGTGDRRHLASIAIDPSNGMLSFADGVTFLGSNVGLPWSILTSPDNFDVYVFGNFGGAQYRLDSVAGTLTEIVADINSGTNRSKGAITPDGKHVYIEAAFSACEGACFQQSLLTFERDPSTGMLAQIGSLGGGGDSSGGDRVLVSPDGKYVYTTRGVPEVYARNATTGALTLAIATWPGANDHESFTPDGAGLLSFRSDERRLLFYAYDGATGGLSYTTSAEIPLSADPLTTVVFNSLAVSPDAATIYGVGSNTFAEFSRDVLTDALALVAYEQFATGAVKGLNRLIAGELSQDGRLLYLHGSQSRFEVDEPSLGSLVVYEREGTDAALTRRALTRAGILGAHEFVGPTMAVSPDGESVLLSDFDTIYGIQGSPFDEVMVPSFGSGTDRVKDFLFTPDGASIYAFDSFGRFRGSTGIVRFDVGAVPGSIVEQESFRLRVNAGPVPGPDEHHVTGSRIVSNASGTDIYNYGWFFFTGASPKPVFTDVAHIKRNPSTNEIATTHFYLMIEFDEDTVPEQVGLAMSSDDSNLYTVVKTLPFNIIQIVDRDSTDGSLRNVRMWQGGVDSTTGPTDAQQIIVSPGGQHVFVLEQEPIDEMDEDGLWITRIFRFNRDPATGDIDLDEIFETQSLDAAEFPANMPFLVSDPDDTGPVVYVGAGDRLLGLDLN